MHTRVDRPQLDAEVRHLARKLYISGEVVDTFLSGATAAEARAVKSLLDSEIKSRAENKKKRLLRRARFPQIKSFDTYDFSQVSFPDGFGPEDLKGLSYLDTAEGFVFYGKTGRGKTHLATAIGVAAISQGRSVKFHSTAQLVMHLERAQKEGSLDHALKDATSADLVILDEFGYVPIDVFGSRILFQIVSDCYERRSLIITTNIEFSKWGTVLGDDKLAAAMIDRIVHHSRLIEFLGTSHRMDTALLFGEDTTQDNNLKEGITTTQQTKD